MTNKNVKFSDAIDEQFTPEEQKLIDLVREGLMQEEIGKQFGLTKSTISKRIKALNEKHPNLNLKTVGKKSKEDTPTASTQAPQKPQIAPESSQPMKSTSEEEKAEEKANTKPQNKKSVMGFKADAESMKKWKLYAEATGQEIGIMCSNAIDEYIKNHPLTEIQKQFVELKRRLND